MNFEVTEMPKTEYETLKEALVNLEECQVIKITDENVTQKISWLRRSLKKDGFTLATKKHNNEYYAWIEENQEMELA